MTGDLQASSKVRHQAARRDVVMSRRECKIVTLPDGSKVRVQGGDVDLDHLQALRNAVLADESKRCHALSPFPMPEIAQKIHGRENYWCGRYAGHEPPHRWPENGTKHVWEDQS